MRSIIPTFVVLALAACTPSPPVVSAPPTAPARADAGAAFSVPAEAQQIDALLTRYHHYGLFNGAVLVAEAGEVIYQEGFGQADMAWDIPNTTDTRFRIGSVTKQFTAALILQLVEEGKIDLHAPVTAYLPDYPKPQGDIVTIHHLLTHTSGIPSYTDLPDLWEEHARDPFEPDSFATLFSNLQLEFEPGTEWSYNNSGYYLLGIVIEHVTGKPYDVVLEERLLEPLGLENTGYDHYRDVLERRARGYVRTPGGYERAAYFDTSIPYAAGMVFSTVQDLFAWDQALYDGAVFRSPESRELMFTPHIEVPAESPEVRMGYGYGWLVGERLVGRDTVRVIFHAGDIHGFSAQFVRLPESHRTVVILDNTTSSHTDDVVGGILKILNGHFAPEPKRPIAHTLAGAITDHGVQAAVARYWELKESEPHAYDFSLSQLNRLGDHYLGEGEFTTAIAVLELNVEAFPDAYNTYDSLAEAHMEAGNRDLAIENYRKSLELNPGNDNAREMLRRLEGARTGHLEIIR